MSFFKPRAATRKAVVIPTLSLCFVTFSITKQTGGQWAPSGDHAALFVKAILDVGELYRKTDILEATPGRGTQEKPERSSPDNTLEWLEFRGHATYCMPVGPISLRVEPAAALILMDPDRKTYIAVLEASSGAVAVAVHRAKLIPCPTG